MTKHEFCDICKVSKPLATPKTRIKHYFKISSFFFYFTSNFSFPTFENFTDGSQDPFECSGVLWNIFKNPLLAFYSILRKSVPSSSSINGRQEGKNFFCFKRLLSDRGKVEWSALDFRILPPFKTNSIMDWMEE